MIAAIHVMHADGGALLALVVWIWLVNKFRRQEYSDQRNRRH